MADRRRKPGAAPENKSLEPATENKEPEIQAPVPSDVEEPEPEPAVVPPPPSKKARPYFQV